ncbi:CHY zinc finger domain-containing protein [Spironucleus salmonicida]|uniref:CHY zinc finger domain-containing protein n=2 Tax=Spironucleus TaxID=39709 RepID=V6LJJ4_9EUKA|nr:CHY zinc finger domain-containing protein [Spironucleus salmonicida]|eukprot:EST43886.1 CHY zinc finger domain-containing protein [Spironucleus salmonicida]
MLSIKNKTTLVTANLFYLKDTSKGFEEENREVFRCFGHSVHTPSELKNFTLNNKKIDPIMPMRFWNHEKTFYENQHESQIHTKKLYTETGIPRRLLKQDFTTLTPLQLAKLYENSQISSAAQFNSNASLDDPDKSFFNFIGYDFVDYKTRRALEVEDPYLYIFYTTSQVFGCEHYARNAFPICPDCNKPFPCRFCHGDEVDDHELDRKRISEMLCLFCDTIVPIGTNCKNCSINVSQICCDICHTLCMIGPEVKPAYHCHSCGVCRVGLQHSSVHCEKCDSCFDKNFVDEHVCLEPCVCPVCQQNLKDTITPEFSLKCNNKHRIHSSCYDQLLQNGTFTCPLDHKIIIDDMQYAMLRAKILHLYCKQIVYFWTDDQLLHCKKYQCYDCEKVCYDFSFTEIPSICHGCFGINCREIENVFCKASNILVVPKEVASDEVVNVWKQKCKEVLSNGQERDQDICGEYMSYYRQINLQLVPRLIKAIGENQQFAQMQMIQMLLQHAQNGQDDQ